MRKKELLKNLRWRKDFKESLLWFVDENSVPIVIKMQDGEIHVISYYNFCLSYWGYGDELYKHSDIVEYAKLWE